MISERQKPFEHLDLTGHDHISVTLIGSVLENHAMQTIDKTVRKGKILGLMSQARGGKPSPTLKLTHLGPTVIGTPSTEDVIIL